MKELYPGEEGTLVSYVQLALVRAGYDLAVDGVFGTKTCQAVEQFMGSSGSCAVRQAQWNRLLPFLRGEGGGRLVTDAVAYSSQLVGWILEGFALRYPYIGILPIGKSVGGTPIWCLRLGSGPVSVCYNASFHANESITTPVLLRFAEELLGAYEAGETYRGVYPAQLFSAYTLYLIPLVNPDGVDLVNGTLADDLLYRQAQQIAQQYPDIPFPSGWKANIRGVDLNLQFPAGWEQAKAIKYAKGYDKPAPRDFVGTTPLSAPESIAVYDFTRSRELSLILAYHTQGEVIYWKYLDYEPRDARRIADYFADASGYRVEETPSASGYAGYKDWFIQTYDRCGYTIEAGIGTNPLPMAQFPQIYEKNAGILLGGMTELSGK